MTGDFRSREGADKCGLAAKSEETDRTDVAVHKEVWESILVVGQAIEESMTKAAANNKKDAQRPKLSTVQSYLNNAYQVRPIPEDIFRASDVVPAINTCLDKIAGYVNEARKVQAQVMDLLYETNDEGVDLDVLQKLLDQSRRTLAVEIDDADVLYEQVELGLDWQKRLDALVAENDLCLSGLEELANEGRSFSFRTKSLVCLESRIQKAYHLRDKIVQWRKVC